MCVSHISFPDILSQRLSFGRWLHCYQGVDQFCAALVKLELPDSPRVLLNTTQRVAIFPVDYAADQLAGDDNCLRTLWMECGSATKVFIPTSIEGHAGLIFIESTNRGWSLTYIDTSLLAFSAGKAALALATRYGTCRIEAIPCGCTLLSFGNRLQPLVSNVQAGISERQNSVQCSHSPAVYREPRSSRGVLGLRFHGTIVSKFLRRSECMATGLIG